MEQIDCRIVGRVQLVMFRDFVVRRGRALGLTGEVENLSDGTVRVVAQGSRESLERLIASLRKGPLLARVDDVSVRWSVPESHFGRFVIRY